MSRNLGTVLVLLLLTAVGLLRLDAQRRADRLTAGEGRALAVLAALQQASRRATARGDTHPGLVSSFLAGVPGVVPRSDLAHGSTTFAEDSVYLYGITPRSRADARTGAGKAGWVLRAWPLRFGSTGDREFQVDDDDHWLVGQNRIGRSGTSFGFPPAFPEPSTDLPRSPWWPLAAPAADHR